MSLLLLWNAVGAPVPPPVATLQAGPGGGGSPGRHYERWEEQRSDQDVAVIEHGQQPPREPWTPSRRIGKPVPPPAPWEAEPWPLPPEPERTPVHIEPVPLVPVPADDDDEAIVMLLESL